MSQQNHAPRTGDHLPLASVIVGAIALVGAFLPVVDYLSGSLALGAVAIGVLALVRRTPARGAAIAGTVTGAVAVVVSVALAVVYTLALAPFVRGVVDRATAGTTGHRVVYEVTSSAATVDLVYDDDVARDVERSDAAAPFRTEFRLPGSSSGDGIDRRLYLGATPGFSGSESATVTCRIIIDGTVVDEQTDSGRVAVVGCSTGGFGSI